MKKQTKIQAIALVILAAPAAIAGLAAYSQQPEYRPMPVVEMAPVAPEGRVEIGHVTYEEPEAAAPAPAPARVAKASRKAPKAKKTCKWVQSQTFDSGRVRICDVPRTKTHRANKLFGSNQERLVTDYHVAGPQTLASR